MHSQQSTSTLPKLNKNIRTMPKWVNESHDRVGPKPPAPPPSQGNANGAAKPPALPPKTTSQPEPDYEVIEFSGQQYSNEPMLKNNSGLRPKTPDAKLKCTLCGSFNPWVTCDECAQQIFCASCDDMFHKHPKRKSHIRKAIEQNLPPIPPKVTPGQPGPTPPIAPPRRSKRGFPTPLLQRKNQVASNITAIPPPSPTPCIRSTTLHGHVDSLKRGMSFSNRPLPETPKTPTKDDMSSRSTTPKSVFDTIQRPPSVTLEKIKSKANATLDRMTILQQRYRQQKEEQERSRCGSVADQNFPFDQWSNISPSPSHFRSGSMSSGLNSSHFDLSDDTHFNLSSRQRPPQHHQFATNQNNSLGFRNMSTSVFNLSQTNRKPLESNNSWRNTQMQQAQSVAHLNCVNCSHPNRAGPPSQHRQQQHVGQQDDWSDQFNSNQQLNRSNLSLNMPAMYMMPQPHPAGMYPPPVFMNQRGMLQNMYPYPYHGMPVMNAGVIGMPPSARSRATSRANSRLPSPTLSRKSLTLRKKQSGYIETDPTDDEDSDQDDRRSLVSNRSGMTGTSRLRQRRVSSVSQGFLEDDSESNNPRNQRTKIRDQWRGSSAKSVQNDWTPGRLDDSTAESGFGLPSKPSKIYSDLDSEGSGTKALVQAKIQQKLQEGPKQKVTEKVQTRVSAEVQAGAVKTKNQEEATARESQKTSQVQDNHDDGSEDCEAEEEGGINVTNTTGNNDNNGATLIDEEDDTASLGPPPSTPDHEWECEFCTFVNEPKIKICSICCKTPSKPPIAPKSKQSLAQIKPTVTAKKSIVTPNIPAVKNTATKPSAESESITNGVTTTPKHSQSDNDSEVTSTKKKVEKSIKNSIDSVEDIWNVLDENIQATAGEIIRNAKAKNSQKVSTGCGPSPPRELNARTESKVKVSKEIATSPPPQTISTQTYDTLPLLKIDARDQAKIHTVEDRKISQTEYEEPQNFKSQTNGELNTIESRSLTSPDGNFTFFRDERTAFSNERDRYRSSNDLRQSEPSPIDFSPLPPLSGLGRRQSSIAELIALQRAQPQFHSQYNLQGFPGEPSYFEYKPARDPETELYLLIKEAELYKFTSEELHVALKHCGSDIHPVQWLRENWSKLIQTVQSLATKYGQERAENTIGTISQNEARAALCIHFGNIWQAVSECIEQRQRKYREISNKGNFSREDIVTALTTHHGNVESALMDLSKTQLKPFLMRIWGSPGGIENESGTQLPPQSPEAERTRQIDPIKNDIHAFLNANALECSRNPSLDVSSFTKDYSFQPHLPTSNDHNYRLTADNLSSYSHDSKENTASPFQLEEFPQHNKSMLKDLETLIGNMEQNQAKQNEVVLRNIEGMLSNLMTKKEPEPIEFEEGRIYMKSPINMPKAKQLEPNEALGKPLDVKNFVWQHIQEIVPDLVQQVEKELMERDEKDQQEIDGSSQQAAEPKNDDVLVQTIVESNMKYSVIKEELQPSYLYAAEIENFRMQFDRARDLVQEAYFDGFSLEEAPRKFYKMFLARQNTVSDKKDSPFKVPKDQITSHDDAALDINNSQTLNAVFTDDVKNSDINGSKHQEQLLDVENQAVIPEQLENGQEENLIRPNLGYSVSREASGNGTIEIIFNEKARVTDPAPIVKSAVETLHEPLEMHSEEVSNRNEEADFSADEKQPTIVDQSHEANNKARKPKSKLPNQKKKITNGRSKSTDAKSSKILGLQSESQLNEFKKTVESSNIPPAQEKQDITDSTPSISTKVQSEFQSEGLKSPREDNIGTQLQATAAESLMVAGDPTSAAELSDVENNLTNSENVIPNEQSTGIEQAKLIQNPVDMIPTHQIPNEITSNKIQKSIKTSKIPVRRSTSTNRNKNHTAGSHENISINLENGQNRSVKTADVGEDATFKSQPEADVDLKENLNAAHAEENIIHLNAAVAMSPNTLVGKEIAEVNTEEDFVNQEVENISNKNEEEADSHDFFQDVYEHSSDDGEEEIGVNPDEAKLVAESHEDEYEEISEDELFSIHSNNTAGEEETSSKLNGNDTEQREVEPHMNTDATEVPVNNAPAKENGNTIMKDFVPSSDPSKQNLSELVMDTKRLIKQMKDEINLGDLESSGDDESIDDYSDEYEEYSNEWDEGEEEGEEEEDGDEEESDFNEEEEDEFLEKEEADDVDDDYTETRYEHEEDDDVKNEVKLHDDRSVGKMHANDNSLSTDSEVEDIEHDDLKEDKSNELQSQNQNENTETLAGIEFSNTHSLSFGASINTANPSSPQNAITVVKSSIYVDEPFITDSAAPAELREGSKTLQDDPTELNNSEDQTVENISIALTAILNNIEKSTIASRESPAPIEESAHSTNTSSNAETVVTLTQLPHSYIQPNESPELPAEPNATELLAENLTTAASEAIETTTGTKSLPLSTQPEARVLKSPSSLNQTISGTDFSTTTHPQQQKTPSEYANISKIPKPKETKKSHIKSKVPLRSKSFSGPPTPMGMSFVKSIQQEFLNRQTQKTTVTAQYNLPSTVFRKKSITETISKLTKPFDSLDGPSTSAAAASIFRKRNQPRIPKKKYHETCFSDDDYQTSSSETEPPEPIKVRQRQQSVPVFRTYPSIQEPEVINPEILAKSLIEDELVSNLAEAQIAAALINMKFQKDVSVWAAKECSDLDQAIALLQQDCELCMGTFALNQMVSMLKCTHKCCKECAKTYFTVQITDRSINDCNCPFCKTPELHENLHEDDNLEYFSNLDIFLKNILEREVHELFQRKLRDRTLLQDPNFKWCVQCSSGFFARPKQKRLICPDCGSVTCAQCRKVWEKQHEGISCEKYLEWKEANDPEVQAQGVQHHLAVHGIDCPKCKFRYSLARGGCMHFTCTQCKFEFCYGCAKPFMMGAKCNVSPYCAKLGLHAHHPRNCLFYLRDKLPLQLQFLLKENGVIIDADRTIVHDEYSSNTPGRCPIPLQKETPKGLVDTVCNGEVTERQAGLCRTHFVEYLAAEVAKARIDPLPIFDLTDCVQELRRRGLPLPERGPWDTDEIYKGMCSEIIKQKIPLESN